MIIYVGYKGHTIYLLLNILLNYLVVSSDNIVFILFLDMATRGRHIADIAFYRTKLNLNIIKYYLYRGSIIKWKLKQWTINIISFCWGHISLGLIVLSPKSLRIVVFCTHKIVVIIIILLCYLYNAQFPAYKHRI